MSKALSRSQSLATIGFVGRLVVGGALFAASLTKLQLPYDFLSRIYEYRILTPQQVVLVATLVPWLELVSGCLLICGVFTRGAMLIGMVLLFVFSIAQALAVGRGLEITCACFSLQSDRPIGS
jgi:uncharacterized membrane protein YphA (DoxX/SURF4 family)